MERKVDLSVIVPCLNEAENIELALDNLLQVLDKIDCKSEIIVVDDQSEDNTYQIAQNYVQTKGRDNITIIKRDLHRRGYGAVVRYGAAHALGKYAIFVSADMVDPIEHLPEFYRLINMGGVDLVQCSRYQNPEDTKTIPFIYKFWQFFYRRLVKLILGTKLNDTTYAFKMFRRTEMLGMGLTQNRFSISPEITFKIVLAGGKVATIAAPQGTRIYGVSKFKFMKEAFGYSYVLLRALLHRTGLILWF